jgi:hypothetical protein
MQYPVCDVFCVSLFRNFQSRNSWYEANPNLFVCFTPNSSIVESNTAFPFSKSIFMLHDFLLFRMSSHTTGIILEVFWINTLIKPNNS